MKNLILAGIYAAIAMAAVSAVVIVLIKYVLTPFGPLYIMVFGLWMLFSGKIYEVLQQRRTKQL